MHRTAVFYIDFGLTLAVIFLTLVVLAVFQPAKKTDGVIQPKAEFMITLTWDDNSPDDLDLYTRAPDGKIVSFSSKSSPLMFLDLDNLGRNNLVTMPDGTTLPVPTRQEVTTIRAIVPGEYVVNVHLYRKSSLPGNVNHAKIRIIKLNPFAIVTEANADFDEQGQERTLANFTVAPDGSVSSVFLAPVQMVTP